MPSGEVDVVVVGGGPAGEVCAARLAGEGLAVTLVEQELVGGECAFWACMPSKALLRPGELLTELARVPGAREAASAPLDVAAVLRRRDEVVGGFDDTHHAERLEQRGVEIVRGSARLAGERCVRVGKEELRARRAVILAPGSAPLVPPIPGLEDVRAWSDREGTTAGKVPARLVIVGGGVVGAELAGAWRSLGAEVVLLEAAPSLLLREEPFAGEQVAACLEERGVEVRCGVQVSEVSRPEGGALRVGLADGAVVEGDELLVAVGRRPRTEELGLETVGLSPGEAIPVDDAMRAGARSWLYAVGDVNERALLTHAGKYQAWVACEQILGRDARASWDGPLSPRELHRAPGRRRRSHAEGRPRGRSGRGGGRPGARRGGGGELRRSRSRRHRPPCARPWGPRARGRHVHRAGGGGAPPRRDHRHGRRGPGGAPAPRHPVVSHPQRGVASSPGQARGRAL